MACGSFLVDRWHSRAISWVGKTEAVLRFYYRKEDETHCLHTTAGDGGTHTSLNHTYLMCCMFIVTCEFLQEQQIVAVLCL